MTVRVSILKNGEVRQRVMTIRPKGILPEVDDIVIENNLFAVPQTAKSIAADVLVVSSVFEGNWCEYKRNLGVEFGEYSLRQYRYAKDYYRIVQEELKKQGEEE